MRGAYKKGLRTGARPESFTEPRESAVRFCLTGLSRGEANQMKYSIPSAAERSIVAMGGIDFLRMTL